MGLCQSFRFRHASAEEVREFLRELANVAPLDEGGGFFIFSQHPGQPPFRFDCELTADGIRSDRAGQYFPFLGLFIEALTDKFGRVEVGDM